MATATEIVQAIDDLIYEAVNSGTLSSLSDRKVGNLEIRKGKTLAELRILREAYHSLSLAEDGGCEESITMVDIRELDISNDGS